MIKENLQKNKACPPTRRGFVILFAVTISAVLLSIALGVANITLREIKFGTSTKDTNEAFFAADSGAECALFYDISSESVFIDPDSPSILCNNSTITANENQTSFWSFTISGLGSGGQSCAKVTVDKTVLTKTTLISKGYNVGSPLCNSTSSKLVEREIELNY